MGFNLEAGLQQALAERPQAISRLKEAGRKVIGYFCCYVPGEIISAFDVIPVRLFRGGSEKATAAGYNYTTPHACPFTAGCIGFRESGEAPYYQLVDYLADAPVCLQVKRMLEVWHKYFGTRLIQIEFPLKYYGEKALDRYLLGLRSLVEELEKITGRPLNMEKLGFEIDISNQVRRHFIYFYELLKEDKPVIQWRDLNRAVKASFLLDKQETLSILKEWKSSLDGAVGLGTEYRGRILLTGGMYAYRDEKLNKIMAELGGDFIVDEICVGSRGVWGEIGSPDLPGIAEKYLNNVPCGSLPHPDLQTDPRIKHLRKLFEEYRVNGVIYYTLRFCDSYSFKVKELRKILSEYRIPLLHIHSDYSVSDQGQMRTRVEAFLESIGS